jgi:hypothetical protein
MISDVLCQAIVDLRDSEEGSPSRYQAVAKEVQAVTTVMQTLQRYLDYPPLPPPTLPAYLEKHDALRESVRRLDVTEIETSTKDLMEHVARSGPAGKRGRESKDLHLHKGAIVLGRAIDEIREYQKPPYSYEPLSREIEVVVTVIKALQQHLGALAQPFSEDTDYMDKVKGLGEALGRLEVAGLETAMKDLYDHLKDSAPSAH